jgi:hypothetical protein
LTLYIPNSPLLQALIDFHRYHSQMKESGMKEQSNCRLTFVSLVERRLLTQLQEAVIARLG